MAYTVEICTDSVESACTAEEAGASRIELCAALSEGGLTPSLGMINAVRENISIEMNVIIRPRCSDFLYTDTEYSVMRRDIESAGEAGADGIVTGILLRDGNIDVERTALLVEYAAPMKVTFHRAFDLCCDPLKALDDIITTGAQRLLTSGQSRKAIDGSELIRELIEAAGDRIIIMPGSGINEHNIATLAKETGAKEFHLSARASRDSQMTYRKNNIVIGGEKSASEYVIKAADSRRIRSIIKILERMEI